jgi:hypothetical protein
MVAVDNEQEPSGLVVWPAVARGAVVTLVLLAAVSVAQAIVDHNVSDFSDSGWIYPFFVLLLVSYTIGGAVAGQGAPSAGLTNGALAGVFGFVAWVPVRILIWVARDEHKGLFTGHSPVLRPGQVFGQLLIAAALGMLGGWLGARRADRARGSSSSSSSSSSSPEQVSVAPPPQGHD